MDLTPSFNDSLLRHNAEPISKPIFAVNKLNEFLQEAYRINSHISELISYLRVIRPAYLTLQPHRPFPSRNQKANTRDRAHDAQGLTDNDRIRIDHETKTLLTSLSVAIRKLADINDAESAIQKEVIARKRRKGLGVLGQWAAGGGITARSPQELEEEAQLETTRVSREAVVWFLQRKLEAASEVQMNMVQIRLDREMERSKSILYRTKAPVGMRFVNDVSGLGSSSEAGSLSNSLDMGKAVDLETEQSGDSAWKDLSPEQMQIFEKEQQDMLKHYNDELNKIKTAESSLLEISSLQSHLAMNLETQSAHIDQLVQDSYLTSEQVGAGNKELKKASERPSTARMVFWATCAFCTTLVVWDWFI